MGIQNTTSLTRQAQDRAAYLQKVWEGISQDTAKNPTEYKPSRTLIYWNDVLRAAPNALLRSALFAVIKKGCRRSIDGKINAPEGVDISYKGEQLDQGDLDVWLSILHALRSQALGVKHRLTSYALLKIMSKTDCGDNRVTLEHRIRRLAAGKIAIKHRGKSFSGSLLAFAEKDEITKAWIIELAPNLLQLFEADQFTLIDWKTRRALNGHQFAQWLHSYNSTHAEPHALKAETLLKFSGSKDINPRSSRQTIRKALDAIAEASKANGKEFSYTINGKKVEVKTSPSATQQRHLAKKAAAKAQKILAKKARKANAQNHLQSWPSAMQQQNLEKIGHTVSAQEILQNWPAAPPFHLTS